MKSIQTIIEKAIKSPTKRLIVAVAQDLYVLEAVSKAYLTLNIEVTLVGDHFEINQLLNAVSSKFDYEIIDVKDKQEACLKAVKLIHSGYGHILMKGLVDTSILLKAVLNKSFGLVKDTRLSHVTLVETANYHKLFMLSDAAMNMYPDASIKKDIVINGVKVLHKLGIKSPNVGVLAAIEKENPKMQATLDAGILKQMNQEGEISGCVIDGPFALDNALNKEAAAHKGLTSNMAGEIDFLLMPSIDAGNIFYKALMFLANAKSASVVCGATCPIVLTSRADTIETKYASIALAKLL
ncbi:MAG: phosphate acyltransferase [Acholeplasma sp.]|nr:phosphate acyltransferase [Acholeplasma sp.]